MHLFLISHYCLRVFPFVWCHCLDPLLDSTVHIPCAYKVYIDIYIDWYLPRCHVGISKSRRFGADRGEDRVT